MSSSKALGDLLEDITVGYVGPMLNEYVESGVPFLRSLNVRPHYFDPTNLRYITPEFHRKIKKSALLPGDVVAVRTGIPGTSCVIPSELEIANCSDLVVFRCGDKVDPHYLSYYLNLIANSHIKNHSVGAIQKHFNVASAKETAFPDVSVSEQRKISAVLCALDAKIDLNNRINAELEALAKTIYDYWFVQFDFPDANGRPYKSSGGKMVWNEALKREIPAGWEASQLRDLVVCNANNYGANSLPDRIVYLDTGNLTENRLHKLEEYDTSKDDVPSRARRVAKSGDVLFSTVRPNQKHHGIIKETIKDLIVSTGFAVLTCIDKNLGGDLIYMFVRTNDVAMRMQRIAESSRSSYPSIAPDDLLDLIFALPEDRRKIERACQFFEQTFTTIWVNEKQNRELTQLRDWLLPLLMNGQVRVA
jgi:type I restriction enzyme S subunit